MRRTIRTFTDQPVSKAQITRLIDAAVQAPSPSNRQPWRFAVVRDPTIKNTLVQHVRSVVQAMTTVIERSHHHEDFTRYGDFFFEPLERAPVVIVPQYRVHDDLIERLLRSGGAAAGAFITPAAMQGELACTAAAVMLLLEEAHRIGLGSCWMAGPTVARPTIHQTLGIEPPWTMLGMVAIGWPDETPAPKPRRSLERIVRWF